MLEYYGAKAVVFDGTRDETADACRKRAKDEGIFYANHVFNPLFYQGTKTYIYMKFTSSLALSLKISFYQLATAPCYLAARSR